MQNCTQLRHPHKGDRQKEGKEKENEKQQQQVVGVWIIKQWAFFTSPKHLVKLALLFSLKCFVIQ